MNKYLDFKEAITQALNKASSNNLSEIVNLEDSLQRVLSKDIKCVKNLPSFNNSAMDGFAIKASDAGKTLKVVQTIFAGDKVKSILKQNECYKIMTGAKVPSDVDTIIPIEDTLLYENDEVSISENVKKGACLRLKGEEQKEGNLLYEKGEVINSSMVAVLASQGLTMIDVCKKLSIAVVSTGNELKEPWEEADEDEIYNCNTFAISSLLKQKGFESTNLGLVPDCLEESISFVKQLKNYDVVITSGGISMGDADFMAEAFAKNGLETIFHGVNIKPGRPIMMGNTNTSTSKTFVICLPGNPLTAMVNMHLFAMPVLNKLQGSSYIYHDYEELANESDFKTKKGRVNVVLGSAHTGSFDVTLNNKYGSGMVSALSLSNSILVTNENTSGLEEKQRVKVIKFNCAYLKKEADIFN